VKIVVINIDILNTVYRVHQKNICLLLSAIAFSVFEGGTF